MGTATDQIQNHAKLPHLSQGKALEIGEMVQEFLWYTR